MKVANFIVWDLETGGFKKEENGLAEIALIAYDSVTLAEIDRYEAIVAPYEQPSGEMSTYTSGALNANGLTMRQINAGKDAKTVANEVKTFCLKHKISLRGGMGRCVSVGHNIVKFDIPYLTYFLEIFKIKYNDLFQEIPFDTILFTRLRWSRDGSIANHQLGTACSAAGIQLIDAHRAMNDVEGNAQLAIAFIKGMREQQQTATAVLQNNRLREKFTY